METTAAPPPTPPAESRSWIGRNWKWVVPVGCLAPLVCCCGGGILLVASIFGLIKESGAYQESLARVQADPRVVAALGSPIEPGYLVLGNVNLENDDGEAAISYEVSGPNGSGQVVAEATKSAGQWTFDRLTVTVEGTGETINLLDGHGAHGP